MDKGSQYRQPLLPSEHTGIAAVANAAASVLCSIHQNLWDMIHFFAKVKSTFTLSFDNKKYAKNRSIPVKFIYSEEATKFAKSSPYF